MKCRRVRTGWCGAMALAMLGCSVAVSVRAAQQTTPAPSISQLDEWLRAADTLKDKEKYAEAGIDFARVFDAARQVGHDLQLAQALCGLGGVDFALGRYAQARGRALRAAEIFERLTTQSAQARTAVTQWIGRANHLLSLISVREGKHDEAKQRSERAVAAYEAIGDRRGRAIATLQLLAAHGSANRERELYDQVITDARAVGDTVTEAIALHSYGDYFFTIGSYAEALPKLEAALALFTAADRPVHLGTTYNSLGRLYRAHGRLDAALAMQLKALAIHEKAKSPFNHLQSLNAVAVTYQSLGNFARARLYFERALALAEQTSTDRIQDFLRANFAYALIESEQYQKAADVLEGVVARGLDGYPSLRMRELAYAHLRLGRRDVALRWAQKSVETCGGRETLNCMYALDRRAEVHAALGDDVAALADLRAALDAIEAVRSRLIPADFFKQQFHLAQEDLYSRSIGLQLRGRRTAEALETAERARSRAFVDLLASRELPIAADTPLAPAADSANAAESIGTPPLVFRGAHAGNPRATATPSDDLLSHSVAPPASSAQLVATARRLRSTVISYWVSRNQVVIWVTAPDGRVRSSQREVRASKLIELIRATAPFDDNDRAQQPHGALTTRGAESVAIRGSRSPAWRELYDLLVRPVRSALPRTPGALLTIIPHGPLGALSFAGLQDERNRYLLEDYAIHYAPSGAALQFTSEKRRSGARTGSMLIVSDPVPPPLSNLDRPLPRLPGARAESRAIAALSPRARVTRLEDASARESSIREAAAGKTVLHFATHAIVRDDEPFSSFLALTHSEGQDDGLLTAQEIYRLRLDSDLVVLSACRSAGGRVTGDGIATFARAFIYAGAPSIVASLWDVADEPTNRLIPDFYRSWLRGASKARALRGAQLRLLGDLRAGKVQVATPAGLVSLPEHPVFWAGFALIGED